MTKNQDLHDSVIRHQVFLERYNNGEVKRLREWLLEMDLDLASQLERRLEGLSARELAIFAAQGSATTARLKRLRDWLSGLRRATEKELAERIKDGASPVGVQRAERLARAGKVAAGVTLAAPTARQINRILDANPFEGQLLSSWTRQWDDAKLDRVLRTVRTGLTLGESPATAVKRIRGTKSKRYKDGILEVSRRSAETLYRTAAAHVSAQATKEFSTRNADVIDAMVWTSVLDGRTCFARGTKVETPSGLVNIENVKPGDTVIGGSGLARSVNGVKKTVGSSLVEVELSNGSSVVCTRDHLFLDDGGNWVEAIELQPGEALSSAGSSVYMRG